MDARQAIRTLAQSAAVLTILMAVLPSLHAQDGTPAQQVGVVEMHRQDVPRIVTLPGRATAYEQVDIRPRVGGVVEEILYTPGQPLAVGDPLFRLDDASYRATVASNEAALATAEAGLTVAQSAYDRAERLEGSGTTTAQVETARGDLASAKAQVDAARAALDYSRTELSWTTITSPIEGFPEVAAVSVGDLVTAGQSDGMTMITRLDPIDVVMMEASARMLTLRSQIESGTLQMRDHLDATLVLETGEVYRGRGQLVTPSTVVSTSTGTFDLRFRFENPDHRILPGMFLRGELDVGSVSAFLVPQRAAQRDNSGILTAMIVGDGDAAERVILTDTGTYDSNWIVTEGLKDGDRLIVDGLKSLQPGQTVAPVAASVNEDGLVVDAHANGN